MGFDLFASVANRFDFLLLRPLFLTFYYAFNSMEMESGVFKGTFNGIENFKYALGVDADFTKDLASAFTSMLTNVPIQIFVSLFIAILLNGQFKGRDSFAQSSLFRLF